MDDVKKTNYRIDTLNQKMGQNSDAQQKLINQKIDAINRNMEERLMNQGRLAEIDTLSQLVGNQNQEHIQLKKEVGNQRQQIQTLVDTVHQLKEALEEERRTSMKQEVRLDHLSAVIDVDHVTLFDLAGDIAQVKMGGTSELSRVNNKIATKAGKREVERQLRALRVEGTHISAQKKPRHGMMPCLTSIIVCKFG